MSSRNVISYLALAAASVGALMVIERAVLANDDYLVTDVVRSWKSRQEKIRRAKWVIRAKEFVPKGIYSMMDNRVLPEADAEFEQTYTLWLDFDRNLVRQEHRR